MVNLPSPTDLFASIGAWSSPLFDQMLPMAYLLIGFAVGAIIIGGIISYLVGGIGNARRERRESDADYRIASYRDRGFT